MMTKDKMRVAVAEILGYTDIRPRMRYNGIHDVEELCGIKDGITYILPNYPECLNAMHSAWLTLDGRQQEMFYEHLVKLALGKTWRIDIKLPIGKAIAANADSDLRCIAFLKTHNAKGEVK